MFEASPLLTSDRPSAAPAHHASRAGASAGDLLRRHHRKLIAIFFLASAAMAGFLSFSSVPWRSAQQQEEEETAGPPGGVRQGGGMEEMDERLAVKEGNGAMAGGATKPNVFFILIDDMGWDDIGYQSTDLKGMTPNLDKLAAGGVKLTNYYSMSICTPARATLMTGRYTVRYGMQYSEVIAPGQPWGIPLSEKLLPEYLQDAGYETHMVGKWHLGGYSAQHLPSQRGFDTYMGYLGGAERYWSRNSMEVILEGGRTFIDFGFGNATGYFDITERPTHEKEVSPELRGPDMKRQYSTDEFQDRTTQIVKSKSPHDEEPLFMYVAHQAVHSPLGLPPEGSFTEEEIALLDAVESAYTRDIEGHMRRWFAEVVMYLDKKVGQLVDLLEEEGWMENSIIVVASDNGGHPDSGGGNYPLRGRKNTYWEGGSKVPALVYSKSHIPEEAWGTEYEGMMHVSDWLPTIASAADVELYGSAGALDGVNQWSHIIDPALASADSADGDYPRTEILHNFDPYTLLSDPTEDVNLLHARVQGAFRSGKYKMLFNVGCQGWYTYEKQILAQDHLTDLANACGGICDRDGTCNDDDDDQALSNHLYDIDADPRETNDLIHELPDVAERLRERWYNVTFQEYADSVYAPTNEAAYGVWISYNWWMAPWWGQTKE